MTDLLRILSRLIRRAVLFMINSLSDETAEELLGTAIIKRACALPPESGLRFLFGLDERLYRAQGNVAVAYGEGVHPKHEIIRYHDFFTSRIRSGEHVLDAGCGIGVLAQDIAERAGARVVGIDLNEQNIARAKKEYAHPSVIYRIGDVLKYSDRIHFNVIVLSNILEHLPDRPDLLRRLQQMAHPSRMLIRVPMFERDWRVPLKKELGTEWRLDTTHEIEYTIESLAEEINSAQLTITHQEVRWGEIWAQVQKSAS